MSVIIIDVDRSSLRAACRLFGGIRAVAAKADVNNGNLGRWLRGEKALSSEGALRVFEAMGLSMGVPDTEIIHEWNFHAQMPSFEKAVGLYFPDGAEVARAPWSKWGKGAIFKQLSLSGLGLGSHPPEIFALSDGRVRAVIRRTAGYPMVPKDFGKNFCWMGGTEETAVFDVSKCETHWIEGGITPEEFDDTWGEYTSWGDVQEYAQLHFSSPLEALAQLMKKK